MISDDFCAIPGRTGITKAIIIYRILIQSVISLCMSVLPGIEQTKFKSGQSYSVFKVTLALFTVQSFENLFHKTELIALKGRMVFWLKKSFN